MRATMTILGLYQYDKTLFDGITLPGTLNKETLVGNLVSELEGLEVLYPSAPIMKTFIGVWSAKMQGVWKKRYDTTVLEYDILRNYDITKSETVASLGENHVLGKGSDNVVNQKFSFDNTDPKDAGKVITTLGSGSDTNGSSDMTTTSREYGDASLRTTQQVLMEERQVAEYNMYDTIINDFKQRFCLMVY
jgi:hypothetical protein